ncbi:hypothetical protein [Rhizobium sp. 1399]|jgi:hypothetical protein|uniref:hypothetical protein n=1 Tax=Rhizobium sp. 1399 TaxID=2817758 RepID=UPI00286062A1|nr:hypothetical protein [Rhizobium sp. 1399]MDR6669377.1 hypothetical protein [Rhizobium sp. 1399]
MKFGIAECVNVEHVTYLPRAKERALYDLMSERPVAASASVAAEADGKQVQKTAFGTKWQRQVPDYARMRPAIHRVSTAYPQVRPNLLQRFQRHMPESNPAAPDG